MQSISVGDVVFGADTEVAHALYVGSKGILSHGSFNLRKFVTNSTSLQKSIDAQEATPTLTTSANTIGDHVEIEASEETYVESTLPINQHSCPDEQKALGVCWNSPCDQLVFSLDGIVETAMRLDPTKRNVVSLTGQI